MFTLLDRRQNQIPHTLGHDRGFGHEEREVLLSK